MPADPADVPAIDFATFILSLSTSALTHLGLAPEAANPRESAPPPTVELVLARQTIDLLQLLEEKTEGNLTGQEENLLDQVLQELNAEYEKRSRIAGA